VLASFSPSGSDFSLFDVFVVFPSPVVIAVVRRVLVVGANVVLLLKVDVVAVGGGSPQLRSAILLFRHFFYSVFET